MEQIGFWIFLCDTWVYISGHETDHKEQIRETQVLAMLSAGKENNNE
jgi:hypothetical protein